MLQVNSKGAAQNGGLRRKAFGSSAFERESRALSGKRIMQAAADRLISFADAIVAEL